MKDDYHCAGCCGYLTLPWSFQKNCNKKSTYTFSPHYPFRQFKIAGHGVLLWKFAKCSPHFGSQHNELNEIEILWEYNSNFQQTLKLATITSAAAASLQQHSFFGQNRKLIKTTFINTFPLEPTLSHLFWCAFICSPLFFHFSIAAGTSHTVFRGLFVHLVTAEFGLSNRQLLHNRRITVASWTNRRLDVVNRWSEDIFRDSFTQIHIPVYQMAARMNDIGPCRSKVLRSPKLFCNISF